MIGAQMIAYRHTENSAPLTWIGRFPVYTSTGLAGAHALAMVLTSLAMFAKAEGLLQSLSFSSRGVLKDHALWQPVTYAFVNPPSLMFLLGLYMLVAFGTEIEKDLGRKTFVRLYVVLLLLPPLALTVAGLFGFSSVLAGSGTLHFAIFVAFAALHPAAELLFGLQARWIALALVAVSALQCLAASDFVPLAVLLLDCGAAYAIASRLELRDVLEKILPVPVPAQPNESPRKSPVRQIPVGKAIESIDPILEKISRTGLGSLTAHERARLEQARADLIAKDGGR